jgi:thioesterase domain-containing protein
MGGIVAFEMARQIEDAGEQAKLVVLLDTAMPSSADRVLRRETGSTIAGFALDLGLGNEHRPDSIDEFLNLPLRDQLAYLLDQAKQAHLVSNDFRLEDMQLLFDIFRNNVEATTNYVPVAISTRIAVIRAEDSAVPVGDSDGWGRLVEGEVDVFNVPGNHFTILQEPNATALAAILLDSLKRAKEGC